MKGYKYIELILDRIEDSLTKKVNYKNIAMEIGVSENTLMKVFSFIMQIPIGEYIRKRRLTEAYKDIVNDKEKTIDIAMKYQYQSENALLRALKSEFGIGIKEIKQNNKSIILFEKYDIKSDLKINGNENTTNVIFDYEIVKKCELVFYGKNKKINTNNLTSEAREFFKEEFETIIDIQEREDAYIGIGNYNYIDNIEKVDFYIAGKKQNKHLEKIYIKNGNWAVFNMKSNPEDQPNDMYKMIRKVYDIFINKYSYKLSKDRPCLEYYYIDRIEFWLSIDL